MDTNGIKFYFAHLDYNNHNSHLIDAIEKYQLYWRDLMVRTEISMDVLDKRTDALWQELYNSHWKGNLRELNLTAGMIEKKYI
jgi:hypothetical protein